MLVCVDKITAGRMLKRARRLWKLKMARLRAEIPRKEAELATIADEITRTAAQRKLAWLRGQLAWMERTIVEMIISEAQNEVRDFAKWGINIIPHRLVMKNGFETADGKRVSVDDAFKDEAHPFRVAIVCAMWLTGFDVECLQTLYIDKPMKAHTLMQAIARANRIYPGKDCGVIVDYNGMMKSLREALAQYALGDENTGGPQGGDGTEPAIPLEKYVPALVEAIEAAEKHLRDLGFDPNRLISAIGFTRIAALRDAVNALYTTDEAKRRFEIIAREVFARMKTLILEPSVRPYYVRHDNIEAIYKKLEERRDTADVTEVMKAIHKIVNEAIRTQGAGEDSASGLAVDLSQIDLEKLRDEFAEGPPLSHPLDQNACMDIPRRSFLVRLAGVLGISPIALSISRASDIEPWQRGPEWLEKWKRATREPVTESADTTLCRLVSAVENARAMDIVYYGGSTPGARRRISPGLCFRVQGFNGIYLSGYCHLRNAERVFRVDLIELTQ